MWQLVGMADTVSSRKSKLITVASYPTQYYIPLLHSIFTSTYFKSCSHAIKVLIAKDQYSKPYMQYMSCHVTTAYSCAIDCVQVKLTTFIYIL